MSFSNFYFYNSYAFYLLILLFVLFFIRKNKKQYENQFSKEMLEKIVVGKNEKQKNFILMSLSFIFLVLALASPVLQNKPIKVSKDGISMIVAFDISRSMQSGDIYPNRLEFAKKKFSHLLKNLKSEKIGLLAFSGTSFLISPITNDYKSLLYLSSNINAKYVNTKGSMVFSVLKTSNKMLKNSSDKIVVIFTDGTSKINWEKEINYAKEHNIVVFVYNIATLKGGIIKHKGDIIKDSKGNIVITRLNPNIKDLTFATNGAYLEYSNSSIDIKEFSDIIKKQYSNKHKDNLSINTNIQLYYLPLILSLIFYFLSISGFKRAKQ